MESKNLVRGSQLMVIGALSFVGYAIVFYFNTLSGSTFELGVDTLNGLSKADLASQYPEVVHYMDHIHVAISGFIVATGIAVASLAHYGVRNRAMWAWITAVVAPVVALLFAIPMHYMGGFSVDWTTHLAPIYLGTIIFVVGALMALMEMRKTQSTEMPLS